MISVYKIRELVQAFKAQIRSTITGVGTEDNTDHGLIANVASYMFQGAQVGAVAVYEQLFPPTADAENRDRMVDYHGIVLTKEATKACGLILLLGDSAADPYTLDTGSQIDFPGTCFPDGVARSYVTTEDAYFYDVNWSATYDAGTGSTEWKLRMTKTSLGSPAGGHMEQVADRHVYIIPGSGDFIEAMNAIRRVNRGESTIEGYLSNTIKPTAGDAIVERPWACVVRAECTVAGKIGNYSGPAYLKDVTDQTYTDARLLEMGGGGDAVTLVDTDERTVRVIEDTIAGAPSLGNLQYMRELALSCPDVDLDDAVVFQHARGPGTIDIVAIGRSGRVKSALFDAVRNDFFMGYSYRRIGEEAAAKIERWMNERDSQGAYVRLSYHDDVRVYSVEYDHNGESYDEWDNRDFYRSTTQFDMLVTALPGYGPDCGVALDYTPYTTVDYTKLYPTSLAVDPSLKVGDRVWVQLQRLGADSRIPYLTVVTTIVAIPSDYAYVEVADLTGAANATDITYMAIVRWGSAGPITQQVIDAVYDYFDGLGPGSYIETPKGPTYLRAFFASGAITPLPGVAINRWPSESRRWPSGLRWSELSARIVAIKGVRSVGVVGDMLDFDPLPLHTLAFRGVIPAYA